MFRYIFIVSIFFSYSLKSKMKSFYVQIKNAVRKSGAINVKYEIKARISKKLIFSLI